MQSVRLGVFMAALMLSGTDCGRATDVPGNYATLGGSFDLIWAFGKFVPYTLDSTSARVQTVESGLMTVDPAHTWKVDIKYRYASAVSVVDSIKSLAGTWSNGSDATAFYFIVNGESIRLDVSVRSDTLRLTVPGSLDCFTCGGTQVYTRRALP